MIPQDKLSFRVAMAARVFVLLALGIPVLWTRDVAALVGLFAIGGVWLACLLLELRLPRHIATVTTVEAALVGLVCGVMLDSTQAIIGALALGPFVAAVYRAVWGVAMALCAELAALVAAAFVLGGGLSPDQGYATFSWSVTGLGLGLIGTFLHTALVQRSDPLAPYHYAQGLLRQLIDISEGLDTGLDPVTIGGGILGVVRDELPTSAQTLHIPRGDSLTRLVSKSMGSAADLARCEEAAVESWRRCDRYLDGQVFAFPLEADGRITGVVAGVLSEGLRPADSAILDRIRKLTVHLRTSAVHLSTALLFAAFRDAATAEERRRLAREMHDGVAQDIASLGYLADALAAGATTDRQREQVAMLRDRISAIVAEIRRSLVNLRTSVGASESLGAAIASIARNLSEVSGLTINVQADELTDRLRPEVEGELFRIAQEAMNNAVKHARATVIEVTCQVRAPAATLVISDNGRGMQGPRKGSHGMEIMHERAHLVGARLDILETDGGGTTVRVAISDDAGAEPEQVTVEPPTYETKVRA